MGKSIGDQLRDLGFSSNEERLHEILDANIDRYGVGDGWRAAVVQTLDSDCDALKALMTPDEWVEVICDARNRRLKQRRLEKQNAPQGAKAGAGQTASDVQRRVARPARNGSPSPDGAAATGQISRDTHAKSARAAGEQDASPDAGGGQRRCDRHGRIAPAENSGPAAQDGPGQNFADAHYHAARPSAQRRNAAVNAAHGAAPRSVFDDFLISDDHWEDGRPIGDIPVVTLRERARAAYKNGWTSTREAIVQDMLADEAEKQAHVPAGAVVRDIFTKDLVQRSITTALKFASNRLPEGVPKSAKEAGHAS